MQEWLMPDPQVARSEFGSDELLLLPGTGVPLVEALNDGIVVAGADNRILYANRAVTDLLGWVPNALVGEPIATIVPERLRDAHVAGFSRYFETGQPHIIGVPTRVPALRSDGTEQTVELVLSVLPFPTGDLAVATLRDVADRVDLERQTALAHHLLTLFVDDADEQGVAEHIVEVLGEELDAALSALWLPAYDDEFLDCCALWRAPSDVASAFEEATRTLRLRRGEGLPGRVWLSGQARWIPDLTLDANFPRGSVAATDRLRSAFAVPVANRSRILGVVELFFVDHRDQNDSLLTTMTAVGARLGEFLERKHLDAERQRIAERERIVAGVLQRSLLPSALPELPGIELGVAFHPGGELVVGGDFYDCFPIDGSPDSPTFGILIGDVCGTGPEAAAVTGLVRHSARALARTGMAPIEVLEHVNAALLDRTASDGRFCTCVFGTVRRDDDGGLTLRIVNAGHPPPLLRSATGRSSATPVSGTLLGAFATIDLVEQHLRLLPGETLVAYTDGVTEARRDGELFGEARLESLVDAASGAVADLAHDVVAASERFASGVSDDMVVLALRAVEPGICQPLVQLGNESLIVVRITHKNLRLL